MAELSQLMGGGYGPTQPTIANVTGNVSTKDAITNAATGFQLGTYMEAVFNTEYWWKVTNDISGYGRWYTAVNVLLVALPRGYRNESCD